MKLKGCNTKNCGAGDEDGKVGPGVAAAGNEHRNEGCSVKESKCFHDIYRFWFINKKPLRTSQLGEGKSINMNYKKKKKILAYA